MLKLLAVVFFFIMIEGCSSSNSPNPAGGTKGGVDTSLAITGFSPDTAVRNVTVVTLTGKNLPTGAASTQLTVGGSSVRLLAETDTAITFMATDSTMSGVVALNNTQAPGALTVVSQQPPNDFLTPFIGRRAFIDIEHTHLVDRTMDTFVGQQPTTLDQTYDEIFANASGKLVRQNGMLVFADSTNYGTAPKTDWQATTGHIVLDATGRMIVELFFQSTQRSSDPSQGFVGNGHMTLMLHNIPLQQVAGKYTATLSGELLNNPSYVQYDRNSSSSNVQGGWSASTRLLSWQATAPETLTITFQ